MPTDCARTEDDAGDEWSREWHQLGWSIIWKDKCLIRSGRNLPSKFTHWLEACQAKHLPWLKRSHIILNSLNSLQKENTNIRKKWPNPQSDYRPKITGTSCSVLAFCQTKPQFSGLSACWGACNQRSCRLSDYAVDFHSVNAVVVVVGEVDFCLRFLHCVVCVSAATHVTSCIYQLLAIDKPTLFFPALLLLSYHHRTRTNSVFHSLNNGASEKADRWHHILLSENSTVG